MTSGGSRRLAPPGGMAPPVRAALPGGESLDLVVLAAEICRRYRDEHPDEAERYGEAGNAWCRHDNQHILNWAAGAELGDVDFDRQLDWLAGVLGARDFPLDRLARDLEIAAEVTPPLAARLRAGAERVRARSSSR